MLPAAEAAPGPLPQGRWSWEGVRRQARQRDDDSSLPPGGSAGNLGVAGESPEASEAGHGPRTPGSSQQQPLASSNLKKTEPGVEQKTKSRNTSVLPRPCDSNTLPLFPTFRVSKRDFYLRDFYKHQNHLYKRNVHTPVRKLLASSTSLRSALIGLYLLGMRALRYAPGTPVLAT